MLVMRGQVKVLLATAIVAGGAWLLVAKPGAARFPEPGKSMPDFAYPSLNRDTLRLSEQLGRVVLVNVWATWCPPCREEMPSMQRLYDLYADSGFTVLAISIDADTVPVRPFVEELGLTFPILLDPKGSIVALYGTAGVPESYVVDKSGKLVLRRIGADDWFSEPNRTLISTLLRGPRF
jgi:peroxiredoxin